MRTLAAAVFVACFGAASLGGQPPASVRHALFSCDGQHLLAQTDLGIIVATVKPFRWLFTIPGPIPGLARFTPDSRSIVFLRPLPPGVDSEGSQFERWSSGDGKRVEAVAVQDQDCHSEALSPDGRVLACVGPQGALRLVEVSSGRTILENKKFSKQAYGLEWTCSLGSDDCMSFDSGPKEGDPGKAALTFSPDGRFLMAVPIEGRGRPMAFDVREGQSVRLGGELKERAQKLSFTAPDLAVLPSSRCKMHWLSARCRPLYRIVAFPSGKEVVNVNLVDPVNPSGRIVAWPGPVAPATDPAFLLEQPYARALNYRTGELVTGEGAILDVCRRLYVTESPQGTLKLFDIDKGLQGTIAIPRPE